MNTDAKKRNSIRNDLILIAVFLVISVSLFLFVRLTSQKGSVAVVTVDGREWGRYPLSENISVTVETELGKNTLVIKDGRADITEADCPTKICVRTKPIENSGETITCLPHKLTVTVEGGDGVDFVQ